jgi:hypothetical protein
VWNFPAMAVLKVAFATRSTVDMSGNMSLVCMWRTMALVHSSFIFEKNLVFLK